MTRLASSAPIPALWPVELAGPRIGLRELDGSDADAVQAYACDPRVTRYLVWGPNSLADTRAHLEAAVTVARSPERSQYPLAVIEFESQQLVGSVRLGLDSERNRRGDLGYAIRRDRWGRGLATEAVHLALHLGIDLLGLHGVRATCHTDNRASARVLEKVGMRVEGRVRDHMLIRGAWRDSIRYALLEPEWLRPDWLSDRDVAGRLVVRQATTEHLGLVIELLSEAAGWLHARGIPQWPVPFPAGVVEEGIAAGDVFVAYHGEEPAGSLALQWADAMFWGEQPDDAGYVHRLVVARSASGRGLGTALLAWAGQRVDEAGRRWLRVDCDAHNSRLRAWYEAAGFTYVGDTASPSWRVSRYQRPVRDLAAAT